MKHSTESALGEYDKKLELSIDFLQKKIRSDIAQVFHSHSSFLGYLEKKQKLEKELFAYWKAKIDQYIVTFKNSGKQIVFLFDIDETLTPYGQNSIRPAGEIIVQYIASIQQRCGLCSARNIESVQKFASLNSGFDPTYLFSTRDISNSVDDIVAEKYGLNTSGSYNKFNAWKQYSDRYPNIQFVLIDDLLDSQTQLFEEGGAIPFDKKFIATDFDIYDYI